MKHVKIMAALCIFFVGSTYGQEYYVQISGLWWDDAYRNTEYVQQSPNMYYKAHYQTLYNYGGALYGLIKFNGFWAVLGIELNKIKKRKKYFSQIDTSYFSGRYDILARIVRIPFYGRIRIVETSKNGLYAQTGFLINIGQTELMNSSVNFDWGEFALVYMHKINQRFYFTGKFYSAPMLGCLGDKQYDYCFNDRTGIGFGLTYKLNKP